MSNESIFARTPGPFLYDLIERRFHSIRSGSIIGRTTGDLVFNNDSRLSRQHARILLGAAGVRKAFIEDLQSTNGVVLNGTRIPAGQRVPLPDGAVIEIGEQLLYFTYTQEVPSFTVDREPRDSDNDGIEEPVVPPEPRHAPPPSADPTRVASRAQIQAQLEQARQAQPQPQVAAPPTAAPPTSTTPPPRPITQSTVAIQRNLRAKVLAVHPAQFVRTDLAKPRELQVTDISLSGIGFLRDPSMAWETRGARFAGRLVAGGQTLHLTLEIQRKTPLVVGCDFVDNAEEAGQFVTRHFAFELEGARMIEKSLNTGASNELHKTYRCEQAELSFTVAAGQMAGWRLSYFGCCIEAGPDGKPRISAGPREAATVINAIRVVGNLQEIDEDVPDAISSALLALLRPSK